MDKTEQLYERIVSGLKMQIETDFRSLKNFCDQAEKVHIVHIGYTNLTRILAPGAAQELSLETYLKCLFVLGLIQEKPTDENLSKISLKTWLRFSLSDIQTISVNLALQG